MFSGSNTSLADIAAVTRNNGDGFGNGNGWWVLIILFAIFGGWGNNRGYGNGSDGAATTVNIDSALQRGFDTQTIVSKLDGINNGICSLGYDQLNQMNGINTNILQTGFGIQNAIQANAIANMQNTNALMAKVQDCCCQQEAATAQLRYDASTNACAITTAIANASQAQIQNCNANYRALHDELIAIQMQNKDEKIAELQSLVQSLNLAQSQANQNNYLIQQLRPCPVPAYEVANPFCNQGNFNAFGGCNGCNRVA